MVDFPWGKRCRTAALATTIGLLGLGLGGCSSSALQDTNFFPKASSFFTAPDWGGFSGAKNTASRVLTQDDFVNADGSCAGNPAPVAAANPPEGEAAPDANAAASTPAITGGIALGMTECEVVQRAGTGGRVELGTDEHGERSATLTYMQGYNPGIYRFRSGRLVSVERVAEPEPPKKPAKPARPKPKQARAG